MRFFRVLLEFMFRILSIVLLVIFIGIVFILSVFKVRRKSNESGLSLILTGQFASPNWLSAHLGPISNSNAFGTVWVVTAEPQYDDPRVNWVIPSRKLSAIVGSTSARLLTFIALTIRYRPDWIAGFHLLFNGLISIFLAKIVRRRAFYFCVGGAAEVADGGFKSENKFFSRIGRPSKIIEALLHKASTKSDAIIFMGSNARSYYVERGYTGHALVNPGGIEPPAPRTISFSERDIDVLFVGRLSKIKNLPLFIDTIGEACNSRGQINAVVVGDGEERQTLEEYASFLDLKGAISFVGYKQNVVEWLQRSKILLLTSETESLSLAVMEALAAGLPVVAPNVGDLGDAVHDGLTGYLLSTKDPSDFARAIVAIIDDEENFERMSLLARNHAEKFSFRCASERWNSFVRTTNSDP